MGEKEMSNEVSEQQIQGLANVIQLSIRRRIYEAMAIEDAMRTEGVESPENVSANAECLPIIDQINRAVVGETALSVLMALDYVADNVYGHYLGGLTDEQRKTVNRNMLTVEITMLEGLLKQDIIEAQPFLGDNREQGTPKSAGNDRVEG